MVDRHYLPVMAGYRFRYAPTRSTQEPAWPSSCHLTQRRPGAVRVGHALPRALAVRIGVGGAEAAGAPAVPPGWTVAVVPGAPAVEDDLTRAVADRPDVTVRTLAAGEAEAHRLCPASGYHLIRPDGYVAAHGHGADRARLRAELTAHLGAPAKAPAVTG
ncbi:hypothetical protein [Nocardiopsis sp. CNR-923]|uniref:aromatic-ring hydroxylase C-terminal domain-containing protein n=1 Tax=Nocardiopsis sp. CNR-923 TaxID=1904965 RepID=UPI0021CCC3FA|nr:hypothetical protein [Nocardiopsis sp. CNR-923]